MHESATIDQPSAWRGKVIDYLSLERNVSIAAAAVFILGLGEELWKKFVPKYLEPLGASMPIIGLYGTAQDFLDAIYQYPGGWLADHLGRRWAFLTFVALATGGYLVYLLSPSWPFLFVGLALVMAWQSMASPAIFAVIGDALPRERRAMGFTLQSILERLPIVIAPIAGGALIVALGVVKGVHTRVLRSNCVSKENMMKQISRREVISRVAGSGAAVALTLSGSSLVNGDGLVDPNVQSANAEQVAARAFRGQHQPRPLSFDPAKLKGLSEKLIRSHWENNYGGAVKALNAVEQRLAAMVKEKDLPAYVYGGLKREELVRSGSVVLHELYFGNLGGEPKPGGRVLDVIKQWFGSYEQWEDEFKKTANALGGGSGWVVFAQNGHTGEFHNYWAWDHMHNVPMGRPLLVLDMYEHAYHMDYGAAAAKYVDAFLLNVNWEEVNRRAEVLSKV